MSNQRGYASVEPVVAHKAVDAFNAWREWWQEYEKELIIKYYEQEYPKQGFIMRYLSRNKTPWQFLYARLGPFGYGFEELAKVSGVGDTQMKHLRDFQYGRGRCEASEVANLLSVHAGGKLQLGPDLSRWVNEWSCR